MSKLAIRVKRKYTRRIFAGALDLALAAYSVASSSRPGILSIRQRVHLVMLAIELVVYRTISSLLGIDKILMDFFGFVKNSTSRTDFR